MPEGFGARLRRQREERQIDLGWIAQQTKIKQSLLEALERDDVSHWPSGIFRRAYIRSYAQVIGLDPDVVLREFLEVHPDPVEVLEAAAAAAVEEAARRNAPAMRLRTMVDSAIGSLARLRRPVTNDGALPAAPPPLNRRVSPRSGARTGAPDGSPATLPGAVAPSVPDRRSQRSPDAGIGGRADEIVAELGPGDAVEPAASPLPADDARQTAAEPSPEIEFRADAARDDTGALMASRLEAVAHLCTEFGRVSSGDEIQALLQDSARALDATGLIVWLWDESCEALRPVLVHGYSDQVLAHLPAVTWDADNATAEAFRSARPCQVPSSAEATGALVVPLLVAEGCVGVLAVELQAGVRQTGSLRALAIVLAAALAQLVHRARPVPGAHADQTHPIRGDVAPAGRL